MIVVQRKSPLHGWGAGLLAVLLYLPLPLHAACRSEAEVPATTPVSQFTDHDDGTVTDLKTGLMWAKCSLGQTGGDCGGGSAATYSWKGALQAAADSTLAGYSDWRLPNIKELRSIVEQQCYLPAINLAVFPDTVSSLVWSASPLASDSGYAWSVGFNSGYADVFFRYYGFPVRLVRGGQ